jgi:hypothetical protein
MLGGEEHGEFDADLGAGLPEELVGEFVKPGVVALFIDLVEDRVVRSWLFGIVWKHGDSPW